MAVTPDHVLSLETVPQLMVRDITHVPVHANTFPGGVRGVEMVSGYIGCSHRGSKFNSQHPLRGSPLSEPQLQATEAPFWPP